MPLSHGLAQRPRKIWPGNLRNAISQAHGYIWQRAPNTWKFYCQYHDLTVGRPNVRSDACLKSKIKSILLWANNLDLYGPCHAPTQSSMTSLAELEELIFQTSWILTEFPHRIRRNYAMLFCKQNRIDDDDKALRTESWHTEIKEIFR